MPSSTPEPEENTPSSPAPAAPRSYMAIYVLLAAAFIAILNETVMSVAIPVVKADLNISAATAGWLTTSFLLTMAIVIPTTGYLIAAFSLRQLFAVCQGLFLAGTALGIFAQSFTVVIIARVIQASGTAVLVPLLMTTVLNLVPEHERGRMMGRLTIVIAVAPAIGPTISGLILEWSNNDWHALFESMTPLAALVLIVGLVLLPKVSEKTHKHIDVLSVFLSAAAFGPLVYALSRMGEQFSLLDAALAAFGAVVLVIFVFRQLRLARADKALLDLRAFSVSSFKLSTIILAAGFMMMFGIIIILPLYLTLRGVEVKTIGLILMPGPLIMGLMGPAVGRLYDRLGARPLTLPGAVILTLGVFGLGFIGMDTPLWWIVACHIFFEIGLGFLFTPLFTHGLSELPKELYADGSAIVNTLQQVAGAAGTATFVAVATMTTSLVTADALVPPSDENVILGYRAAMYAAAAVGVVLIAMSARLKRNREKTQLR